MATYTREDHTDLLANAVVTYVYRDGVHSATEIKANDGYALTEVNYIPEYDDDGNEIPRLYHRQIGGPASLDYTLFVAVFIEEGMEVAGGSDKPEII